MPYVNEQARALYDPLIRPLAEEFAKGDFQSGDMNYSITRIVRAALGETPNYTAYNEIIGVLESVKLELYRRAVSPYEDDKRDLHGDVY